MKPTALNQAILTQLSGSQRQPPQEAAAWRSFNGQEWARTLTWMDLGGLALYFQQHMKAANSLTTLPDDVQANLEKRSAGNRLRVAGAIEEVSSLSQELTNAGVRYAILKGIALVPDYCPDPDFRTQYDHDVLVDQNSLEGAEQVLRKAGYLRKHSTEEASVVYYRREPRVRFAEDFEGLYSPLLGRSIELHLTLWERTEEKIEINMPDDFLERSAPRRWRGLDYMALADEDCLLFQILHAFRHILRNWCRLSIFLEIAYFLNRRFSDSVFWERFAHRIDNLRWAPDASLVVFSLAHHLFGASIPLQIQDRLTTRLSPALNLWTEIYGRRSALSNFHSDKRSLFLHREFVDDPSAWMMIRRRRLFPLRRPHRPPAIVFQRGFSYAGRLWMESVHAFRRLRHHAAAGLGYAFEYPRWIILRRARLDGSTGV